MQIDSQLEFRAFFGFISYFGVQRNRVQPQKNQKIMAGTLFVIFCFASFTPKMRGIADKANQEFFTSCH